MDTTLLPAAVQGQIICLSFFKHVQPHCKDFKITQQANGSLIVKVKWKPFDLQTSCTIAPEQMQMLQGIPFPDAVFWYGIFLELREQVQKRYAGGKEDKAEIVKALTEGMRELEPHVNPPKV